MFYIRLLVIQYVLSVIIWHCVIIFQIKAISAHSDSAIAVLVFACNRVTVVRCLDQLLKYRPSPEKFPIIVSQDCQHEATANAIRAYGDQIFHIQVFTLYIAMPFRFIYQYHMIYINQ